MSSTLRRQGPLLSVLALATVLFVWQLSASGYANAYYSAAAQAGAQSWKAWFFGSLDAANGITVDKPPLALWPIGLSVRVFGLSSWSILLPQAVEGIASVGLLYACVRHTTGRVWVAVVAGLLYSLTPVVVLVFRYNNPDAMLTLLLLVAGYATLRAVDSDRVSRATWWLVIVGAAAGLGFLTKMLEAFVVLPALWVTFLVHGRARLRRRTAQLVASGLAVVAAAGWWVAVVELWPVGSRPFVGGSPTNSVLQLALGYNGVGRLTGSTGTTASSGGFAATNIARISRTDIGGEITWLLPAALVLGTMAWLLSRRQPDRERLRAALWMWSGWLVVATTTFALMAGIFHSYYTVILAPAVAALVAIGCWLGWEHRELLWVRRWLAGAAAATTALGTVTWAVLGFELRAWTVVVFVAGTLATIAVLPWRSHGPLTRRAAVAAFAGLLLGPAMFSWATVGSAHVGSGPMAGPGRSATTTEQVAPGLTSFGGGFLGGDAPIPAAVAARVGEDAGRYRWVAATLGSRAAAAYELTTHAPVLAIGGYKGADPSPTLAQFEAMVARSEVHWFIPGGTYGAAGTAIQAWVQAHFAVERVYGYPLYDLTMR